MSVKQILSKWRKAIITFIAKSGLASNVSNYRPISLTSVVCKKIERIVVKCLSLYLYQHKLINQQQRGFRTGKCISTKFSETLNDWTLTLVGGSSFTAAHINVANSFDSVSRPI